MSRTLKQLAKSSGERRRMILQSLDTARYQKDKLADTKIDVDLARSEMLSAHILLPEVLACWTCNGLVPVTCLSLCHPGLESQGAYAAQI
jgi:cellobiose-specific phosphotransferase system component IIA